MCGSSIFVVDGGEGDGDDDDDDDRMMMMDDDDVACVLFFVFGWSSACFLSLLFQLPARRFWFLPAGGGVGTERDRIFDFLIVQVVSGKI
jgi:hypothetical protein